MGIHQATNPTIHSVTYPTAEPDSYPDTLGHTSGHQVTNPVTGQAVHPATDPTIHRAIDPYTHQDTTGQPITIETWHPFTAIQGKILFSLIAAGGRTSRNRIRKALPFEAQRKGKILLHYSLLLQLEKYERGTRNRIIRFDTRL